ncbi:N-6 DNA methylase [Methanosphaera sp. ISO3-F5]|uniref:N-6 DNA methylase n=1 Tax=Methanosphaera sp. ISO3-F5 TaxID=1452353 RepID=UPI002B25A9B0|nr:N-6 DNA methylase [Methanosphaera sp. ISO3-F5]WQH63775.1 N-6 DNA methylase [Methanosphaera sp. ISO3-F5]
MDEFERRMRRIVIPGRNINPEHMPFITMKYLSDKQEETINKNEFLKKYGFLFRDYELLSNIIEKQEEEDESYISDIKSSIIALKNSQNKYIKEVYSKINEDNLKKEFLDDVLSILNTDLNLFNIAIRNKYRRGMTQSPLKLYKLMADIATSNHKVSKVYDPTCHEGLSITSLKEFDKATLYEQDEEKYTQAIQNFIVNDIPLEKISITNKEVLIDEDETKYDTIVSLPFLNTQRKITEFTQDKYSKYKSRNPLSLYLLNLIEHLDETGLLITTITQDILVRKDAQNLRKCLIENNLLDAVFEFEGIRGFNELVIIINKNKNTEDVLFIKIPQHNVLRSIRERRIVKCFMDRSIIKRFSNVVSKEEIIKNEYKLLPKRYVYSLKYETCSIEDVKTQQEEYTEEIRKLDEEIGKLLEELKE